jgi:hypothetical protein
MISIFCLREAAFPAELCVLLARSGFSSGTLPGERPRGLCVYHLNLRCLSLSSAHHSPARLLFICSSQYCYMLYITYSNILVKSRSLVSQGHFILATISLWKLPLPHKKGEFAGSGEARTSKLTKTRGEAESPHENEMALPGKSGLLHSFLQYLRFLIPEDSKTCLLIREPTRTRYLLETCHQPHKVVNRNGSTLFHLDFYQKLLQVDYFVIKCMYRVNIS